MLQKRSFLQLSKTVLNYQLFFSEIIFILLSSIESTRYSLLQLFEWSQQKLS